MNIQSINMADFSLVEIKNNTPHCKKHGAMNKVSHHKDNGGIWRCISTTSNTNLNTCRSGCLEVKLQ